MTLKARRYIEKVSSASSEGCVASLNVEAAVGARNENETIQAKIPK